MKRPAGSAKPPAARFVNFFWNPYPTACADFPTAVLYTEIPEPETSAERFRAFAAAISIAGTNRRAYEYQRSLEELCVFPLKTR